MRRPSSHQLLIFMTGTLTLVGAGFVAVTLLSALYPTRLALDNLRLEIDLSNLESGKVLKTRWRTLTVFVVRRTPEQLAWLKAHTSPTPGGFVENETQKNLDPKLRSVRPEIFVTAISTGRREYYIEERGMFYGCEDFRYTPDDIPIGDSKFIRGGLYCAHAYGQDVDTSNSYMVYDLTGRSVADWAVPLPIPLYTYDDHGKLILGPTN
jgi:Rieske Fe-S protein